LKYQYAFCILILYIAALLRLYHLTQQSFWFDEAFAWNIVIQPDMFPRIAADTHPPLFYLLLRVWMNLMGDSEFALRSLSVFISLLTVAVIYPLGREIAKQLRMATIFIPLIAMLFFALNDADIFHAQEARNYALYNLLGATSIWLYLRWTRIRTGGIWWAITIALLVYTHYQGVFIPAIIGLHGVLFLRDKTRLYAFLWLMLSGILLAPWMLLVTIPQAQNALQKGLPFAIPSNTETLLDLRQRFLGAMWVLVIGLMGMGIWGAIQRNRWGMGVILGAWVVIPFTVLFVGNIYAPLLTDRKLLLITPAICLLMAMGVAQLDRFGRGLVIIAMVIYSLATVDFYHQREPWRDIANTVLAYAQPQDLFLAEAEVGQYPLKYYFTRHMPADSQFYTFTFLGDPTMSPTTDWYTYYDLFLPDVLSKYAHNQTDNIATAWVVFWSNDRAVLDRLATSGYTRTWTHLTDHLGNIISTYRYDKLSASSIDQFANGMILRAALIDQQALRLDLWWSASTSLSADYTTAGGLLNADGILVAQWDSFPPIMTSQWDVQMPIYDPKPLQVVDGYTLSAGDYTAIVKVYLWDGAITDIRTQADAPYVVIGTVRINR
jgi:hypothetical protein